jgi:hypothetical protein
MDASQIRTRIQHFLDEGFTVVKKGDDAILSQPRAQWSTPGLVDTLMNRPKQVKIIFDKPVVLKEKCVYRSADDVFEIIKLNFHGNFLDNMTVKIVSAFDEIHEMHIPRAGIDFNSLSREELIPYLATARQLQTVSLLYFRLENKQLKTVSGLDRILAAVGWSSHDVVDPRVMLSGIKNSCPQDLQDARAELDALKNNLLVDNVDKLDFIKVNMSIDAHRVKIESVVNGKHAELNIRVGDTIETQVPLINGQLYFHMADLGTGAIGPGVVLQTVKCKVIHLEHLTKPKGQVLFEVKDGSHYRFNVSVDSTLYFWKHISVLNKYLGRLGIKNSIRKQLTRRGGYTSKTTAFSPKKKHKKTSKKSK